MSYLENTVYGKTLNPELHLTEYLEKVCDNIVQGEYLDIIGLEHKTNAGRKGFVNVRLEEADNVISIAKLYTEKFKGLPWIQSGTEYCQTFIAILITGIYLYYLFENKNHQIVSLVSARDYTKEVANECKIPANVQERIYEITSAALGINGPEFFKARPDTPNEVFCLAKWIYDNKTNLLKEQ